MAEVNAQGLCGATDWRLPPRWSCKAFRRWAAWRLPDQATVTGQAWRLPNAKELASLAKLSSKQPAIDTAVFPNTRSEGHWVSSPNVFSSGTSGAWQVDFFQGYLTTRARQALSPLRLVRPSN